MEARSRARRDAFLRKIGGRPLIMGIVNLTPDSFHEGGRFQTAEAAVVHAQKLAADGCDIIDIGGESTRPGAASVAAAEELARIAPVLSALAATLDIPLSIDTYKAAVAARATELGAVLVNDVGGLQRDPAMADAVAAAEAALVIVHSRKQKDESVDIVSNIRRFFDCSLTLACRAGIPNERIILDPGIGFGKTSRQNRAALARIPEFLDYGLPILVGVSRKAFLGSLTGDKVEASLIGTVTAGVFAVSKGAAILRVHDVAETAAALKVFAILNRTNAP